MGKAIVRDHVIWFKHLDSDVTLAERLSRLGAGHMIRLVVDGFAGKWAKMDDGKDGRATPGLRPLGEAKEAWNALFNTRRGESVDVYVASGLPGDVPWAPPEVAQRGFDETGTAFEPKVRIEKADPLMRGPAIEALLNGGKHGYNSDVARRRREEFYDRAHDRGGDRLQW